MINTYNRTNASKNREARMTLIFNSLVVSSAFKYLSIEALLIYCDYACTPQQRYVSVEKH